MKFKRYQRARRIAGQLAREFAVGVGGVVVGLLVERNRPGGTYHHERSAIDLARVIADMRLDTCCHD